MILTNEVEKTLKRWISYHRANSENIMVLVQWQRGFTKETHAHFADVYQDILTSPQRAVLYTHEKGLFRNMKYILDNPDMTYFDWGRK